MNSTERALDPSGVRLPTVEGTVACMVSPPGIGGIAVIEIVGPRVFDVVRSIFVPVVKRSKKEELPPGRLRYGTIRDGIGIIDEAIVSALHGPRPTVEISCHGGDRAAGEILDLLRTKGVRILSTAEYLAQTVDWGLLDRIQAEATEELLQAKTWLAAKVLLLQRQGALSRKLRELRARAEDLSPETSSQDAQARGLHRREGSPEREKIAREVEALLATFRVGLALCRPRNIFFGGSPNVGKSSLFNAFLREDRAIVTSHPGTTRDLLDELIALESIPLEIVDSAGLREASEEPEGLGVALSLGCMEEADLVLLIFDGSRELLPREREFAELPYRGKFLPVINKIDLPMRLEADFIERLFGERPALCSAIKGNGLRELEERILQRILPLEARKFSGPVVFTERQYQLLEKAFRILSGWEGKKPALRVSHLIGRCLQG
jgi:tRNA modification GTPase